ncbi:transposase [Novosphingobium sp. PY1]|nr:transposase [Novosphingobium sp. PY1]
MTEWSGEIITVETRVHPLVVSRAYEGLPNLLGNGDAPMSYDYHIGVDYHKAYTHLVVQDDPRSLAGFLAPYPERSHDRGRDPPHRSTHAAFPHVAPTSGV